MSAPSTTTHEMSQSEVDEQAAVIAEEETSRDSGEIVKNGERSGLAPYVLGMADKPHVLTIVDETHGLTSAAMDATEAEITDELNEETNRVFRVVRNIWKGTITRPYHRITKFHAKREEIIASQDLLVHEASAEAAKVSKNATLERFMTLSSEVFHKGEKRKEHGGESPLATGMKALIEKYVKDELNDETLAEERSRFLSNYRAEHGTAELGEGLVQIDNMLNIAKAVKGSVEHGASLQHIMDNMRVITGQARSGVRTEAKYDRVDRFVDKRMEGKVGKYIPLEVIAAAASVVPLITRMSSSKLITAAALTLAPVTGGIGGIAAGTLGYIRERKRVGDERVQHSREMAQGKSYEQGSKRRERMEETRYETKSALDLVATLDELFDKEKLDSGGKEALETARDALVAIETRIKISDEDNVDLISYSDVASIEMERFALDHARAIRRVQLKRLLANGGSELLGLAEGTTVQDLIDVGSTAFKDQMTEDRTEKDKLFKRLRRKRALAIGGIGLVAGEITGMAVQEVWAMGTDTSGLVEQMWHGSPTGSEQGQHLTMLNSLAHGGGNSIHNATGQQTAASYLGDHGKVSIDSNHSITHNPDGSINVLDKDGKTISSNLAVTKDGQLTPESVHVLQGHGMKVDTDSHQLPMTVEKPVTSNVHDFMTDTRNGTAKVTRDYWNDNNTPQFDKNELGLHWGDNNGIRPDGGVQMSVATMTANGSYHGNLATNWMTEAQAGRLQLALSATEGTQDHVLMVKVNPDGTINIPAGSPAAQMFTVENGRQVFHGRYAEVVQVRSVDANHVIHMAPLATYEGNGSVQSITHNVPQPAPTTITTTTITSVGGNNTVTEISPVIPVTARNPLEAASQRRTPPETPPDIPGTPEYALGGYPGLSPEQTRGLATDRMPELRDDPSVRIDLGRSLAWHDTLTKTKDPDYAREIEAAVDATPGLANIDSRTKAVVTIPVGAKLESENIYRTLSLYGRQDKEARESTLLLLHVNWINVDDDDPKVIETKKQIARAMRDYPDLRISTLESVWDRQKIDNGDYGDRLIGHVSQKMYDSALFAVRRAIEDGRMAADSDMLVIKNDADALGMDRQYLTKMVRAFEQHPENDTFTGGVRMETKRHGDLPGLGFVTNFWQMARITSQLERVGGNMDSFGVNTAVRMSTFAAVGGIGHYTNQTQSDPDDLAINGRVDAARMALASSGIARGGIYGATGGRSGKKQHYHRHVVGATIDTDVSRMEEKYVQGIPITDTWKDATQDDGSMRQRTEGLNAGEREDLRNKSNDVISRIEMNVGAISTKWILNEAQARSALAFMLPGPDQLEGKPAYKLEQKNGGFEFHFTPQGRRWVINRLQRTSPKGKSTWDPYGARVARQLYGRVVKGAKIAPKRPIARMVGGL